MAQATLSIRMDKDLKGQMERLCADFGMNVSTAVTVFAKAIIRERKIPFEIAADTDAFFTHPVNRARLLETIDDYRNRRGKAIVKTMEELEAMAHE